MDQHLSVVLISVDTLRVDVAYSGIFPTIQLLRREGTTFRSVVSSSPLTPVSHASILTGLQPPCHGIRHLFRERLRPRVHTLAQAFRDAGYRTCAIVSCPGLNAWYGLDRGFDHYDDEISLLADGADPLLTVDVKMRGTALKRADLVVSHALGWLEEHRTLPFFQFVHFFDSHWPYEAPVSFVDETCNPYEDEVAYVDHYAGKYIQQLADWNLLDSTIIVLLSDHGEDLGGWYDNDHGGAELGHPEEAGHGCLLYDATQMVPLIFRWPGCVPAGVEIEVQVRLVDVAPTIAEWTGLDFGEDIDGVSLASALAGEPLQSRSGYCETFYPREQYEATGQFPNAKNLKAVRIDNRYKVIWQIDDDGIEFYDLVVNPNERMSRDTEQH